MEKYKPEGKNYVWVRFFILIGFISAFSFWFYHSGYITVFLNKDRLLGLLTSMGAWSLLGFIALQAAQVVLAPIPGEITGMLGGYLYGPVPGIVFSTIGLTAGSYVAFTLSRIFGRPFVDKFVNRSTMERFDYVLHHKGAFLVFLLFLIPGIPKDYLCYILGLGHLNSLEFLCIMGTGRLLGTVLLTFAGNYIRQEQYGRFFLLLGVALIIILVALFYRDRLERIFRNRHLKSQQRKQSQ